MLTLLSVALVLVASFLRLRHKSLPWLLLAVACAIFAVDSCGSSVGFRHRREALPS